MKHGAIYIIRPDFAGIARIICETCGSETRYWDERSAARWKVAHSNGCPGPQPRLGDSS